MSSELNVHYQCVRLILIALHVIIVLILVINVFISMLLFGPKLSAIIAFYDSCENLCADGRDFNDLIYNDWTSLVAITIFFSVVANHVIAMIGVIREQIVVSGVTAVFNAVIALFFVNLIKTNLFLCQLFVILFSIVFIVFIRNNAKHVSNNGCNCATNSVNTVVPIIYCPHHNESLC